MQCGRLPTHLSDGRSEGAAYCNEVHLLVPPHIRCIRTSLHTVSLAGVNRCGQTRTKAPIHRWGLSTFSTF